MMSRDSICGRVPFRWICPLCTIMAFAVLSVLPIGAAAQGAGDRPALAPGLHALTLARAGEPGIGYAISIPPTYSPSTPASLILALHYGIGNRDSTGVGADLVRASSVQRLRDSAPSSSRRILFAAIGAPPKTRRR